jgi:hypothetical protein
MYNIYRITVNSSLNNVLFKYLMEFEIQCIDVNEAKL